MIEQIALYLAGLSFFFTGVAGISDNLRQLSGQRFRHSMMRATDHPVAAALLGAALGSVTQSTSVVASTLSGMTAAGLLSMRRALLVLSYSNLGTALLVFIAALDLHLPILFLIGASGLILAFKLFKRLRPGIAGLLSVGLVFFGLDMAKHAFHPGGGSPGLATVTKLVQSWPDGAFLFGVVLRTITHSSSSAAAITMTINKGNLFGEFASMMSVAGLGVGAALATLFLSSNLRGVARQISLYQAISNGVAGLLLGVVLMLEHATGAPLLMAMMQHLSGVAAQRLAYTYFLFSVLIVLVGVAGLRWAPAWLARVSPPTLEQDLSRPRYLEHQALSSPETALDLVKLEQLRIAELLQRYLEVSRGSQTHALEPLHEAAELLNMEITHFMASLIRLPIANSLAKRIMSVQRKQETLQALESNVFRFAQTLQADVAAYETAERLIEALDTIVLTATDALTSKDAMDVDILMRITDDRGPMMEKMRTSLQLNGPEGVGQIGAIYYATTLFERNVWLLRQLALWMREDALMEQTETG